MKRTVFNQIAVFLLVLGTLTLLSAAAEQKALADKLVRLHVIANSDSPADQSLKLKVRDGVLDYTARLLPAEEGREAATERLSGSLEDIRLEAERIVRAEGYDYPVSVSLGNERYDTRTYDNFALPPGNYRSLIVTLGGGTGQNWWCVLFPPLCFSTAEGFDDAAETAGLSDEEIGLITGEDSGYVVKFKCIELVEQFIGLFQQ